MSLVGRLVRVSEKPTGPVLSPAMGKMRGRIGIVHKDEYKHLSIFFGKDDVEATKDLTWHHESVSVYDTFLVAKQDVRWLHTLHTEYDDYISSQFAVGDWVRIRSNLSDDDKYVHAIEQSLCDLRYKTFSGRTGIIKAMGDVMVRIHLANTDSTERWTIPIKWLEKINPEEKQTIDELKDVETALNNVAEAVERIAKKIKR